MTAVVLEARVVEVVPVVRVEVVPVVLVEEVVQDPVVLVGVVGRESLPPMC